MTKRMLIDATHAEETRVVVLDGNRLEDFDVETSTKRYLKGNIYLAKVVRVEPSLQAAFVEYGGNRHGFLAFGEIHPDYYQIPVADRQRLIEMQAEEARRDEEEEDRAAAADEARGSDNPAPSLASPAAAGDESARGEAVSSSAVQPAALPDADADADIRPNDETAPEPGLESSSAQPAAIEHDASSGHSSEEPPDSDRGESEPQDVGLNQARAAARAIERMATRDRSTETANEQGVGAIPELIGAATSDEATEGFDFEATPVVRHADTEPAVALAPAEVDVRSAVSDAEREAVEETGETHSEPAADVPPPEIVGGDGDGSEEARDRRIPPRYLRNYKIQEVIKRRQILLVQVVKEERGTKGAALTTYLSLAGRYCVLMPNSPRGGGISRKITSATDRRRLKEITAELEIPIGMGLIVRTAGANRPKPEIKRDCEYLMRLWDDIRDHTMRSVAPAVIYEEASLIKRAIRDVYSRDLEEIVVDGEDGWRAARDFMRMVMPSHAKKVQLWRDGGQPLLSRYQVDAQLDAMLLPTVQLKSGGYLVINQTEALVAIDVNSGRSTRERGIEETALRTNLEAADEVARQLRLRDLAGLIVIDFIDMESKKNNASVERRLKEALKNDRARIQVGHISHFGLLEMSRQRLRPSLAETSFSPCPHCGGSGHVRSTESSAIHVLRQIEDEAAKRRSAEVVVHAATPIVLYVLNYKRARLAEIEARHGLHVSFATDDALIPPDIRIERIRAATASELPPAITPETSTAQPPADLVETADMEEEPDEGLEDEVAAEEGASAQTDVAGEDAGEAERRRRRRRRRRRGGRREDGDASIEAGAAVASAADDGMEADAAPVEPGSGPWHIEGAPEQIEETPGTAAEPNRERSRSRRGGRRRRRDGDAAEAVVAVAEPGAEQPDLPYSGPTPANPFGGQAFDIFDLIDGADHPVGTPQPTPATAAPVASTGAPAAEEPMATPLIHPISEPEVVEIAAGVVLEPEPLVDQPGGAAPEATEVATLPEPPTVPEPPLALAAAAAAPQPANDVEPEPATKPIIVGAEGEPVVKKRGWWRR